MKDILLVRHAKSSWDNPYLEDIKRPLNERGKRDSKKMPQFLRKQGVIPDYLISSPAKRAFKTAKKFAKEFKNEIKGFDKTSDLYFGSIEDWLYEIQSLEEYIKFPAFFSHNPNLTMFANQFTSEYIDNVPTCGVVYLQSTAERWNEVHPDNTRVNDLYFPKLVFK